MDDSITSPSGRFRITLDPWEARMSLWVETPTLTDTLTGATLLSFSDANWSLNSAAWQSDAVVELRLRKYPGSHAPPEVAVTLDSVRMTARLADQEVPLAQVEVALERLLGWPQPPAPPPGLRGVLQRLYRRWRGWD